MSIWRRGYQGPLTEESWKKREKALAYWTPEQRKLASDEAKVAYRERKQREMVWRAEDRADREGWKYSQWPRLITRRRYPSPAERAWALQQSFADAELMRWRKRVKRQNF